MRAEAGQTTDAFTAFVGEVEPRLRRALVATYGSLLGREAALDALSWAWEHWGRLEAMANPVGYLYRVGQTAARRHLSTGPMAVPSMVTMAGEPDTVPELEPALHRLSEQQRAAVVLVHGYGFSLREAADVLDVGVSTLREHLGRGMARLREAMEDHDEQ